jgi:precorrin-6A/cobalt-precorrin-6A reductase
MHGPDLHQGPQAAGGIWLFAGTAEGPPLSAALLRRGWPVQVSVVTPAAARAYPPHPQLRLRVETLENDEQLTTALQLERPHWVVDATHPFARQISARLERCCHAVGCRLQQLERRLPEQWAAGEQLQQLERLEDLAALDLAGERLLLAIGARQLPLALANSGAAAPFARVLDQPGSLQSALASGLPEQRIACLRPDAAGEGRLERALCRRWQITRVLCRQGGGRSEALWRSVCCELGLPLLLLKRPSAAAGSLSMDALLTKLGQP